MSTFKRPSPLNKVPRNKTKATPHATRVFLLIPSILMLFFAAYLSFRWALADVLSIQVRHQLGIAQSVERSLDAKQWRMAHNLLEKTLWLHPDYSEYLEMAELFYQVADSQPVELLNELGWHNNQEKALDYARRALLISPARHDLWDELVSSKVELKQFDSELTGAIERAVSLGPWDGSVQYDIALTGLDEWDNLENSAKRWVVLALEKTLIINSESEQEVEPMLEHINLGKLCHTINEAPKISLKELINYCE